MYDVSDHAARARLARPRLPVPARLEDRRTCCRIVVRNGFSRDLAELLLDDLEHAIERLGRLDGPLPPVDHPSTFHH